VTTRTWNSETSVHKVIPRWTRWRRRCGVWWRTSSGQCRRIELSKGDSGRWSVSPVSDGPGQPLRRILQHTATNAFSSTNNPHTRWHIKH